VGCTNWPRCSFTKNLTEFTENELELIRYPVYREYKGECNRCGRIRTLNERGLCSACEDWYERQ